MGERGIQSVRGSLFGREDVLFAVDVKRENVIPACRGQNHDTVRMKYSVLIRSRIHDTLAMSPGLRPLSHTH